MFESTTNSTNVLMRGERWRHTEGHVKTEAEKCTCMSKTPMIPAATEGARRLAWNTLPLLEPPEDPIMIVDARPAGTWVVTPQLC